MSVKRLSFLGFAVSFLGAAFAACSGGSEDTPAPTGVGGASAGASGSGGSGAGGDGGTQAGGAASGGGGSAGAGLVGGGGAVGGNQGGSGGKGGASAAGGAGGGAGAGGSAGGTGGATTGGSGGAGSGGGQSGTAGIGGSGAGQSGSGGFAGALGGDGGGPSGTEAPMWEPVVNPTGNCKLDRLTNPGTMRAPFKWVKCDIDLPGCLMLELDPALTFAGGTDHRGPAAYDDGVHKWILMRFGPPKLVEDISLVSRYDGVTVGGYWSHDTTEATGCYTRDGSIGAGYVASPFVFPVAQQLRFEIGALVPGGGLSLSPPVKGSTGAFPNVDNAWLPGRFTVDWQGYRFETYDAKTGADVKLLAGDVAGGYWYASSMGDHVVTSRFTVPNDQLLISDGAAELSLLYDDPDASSLSPVFDGENLLWVKAVGRNFDGTWQHGELWGSPKATTPAAMKPKFISPFYPGPTVDFTAGFGYVAGSEQYPGGNQQYFFVITVKTGERRRASIPANMRILTLAAVMRDEVLVMAGFKGKAYSRYYRVPIAAMPVVPF